MRAVALRDGQLVVRDDVAEPEPSFGQVLVQVKACGICGSDLHFAKHGATLVSRMAEVEGVPDFGMPPIDLSRDIFMGHEFSAEVLEAGPDTDAPTPGTIVTSIPVVLTASGVRNLVYSNELPAGYSERMVLSAPLLQVVPEGVDPRHVALTEPMSVGLHAVNRSEIKDGSGALVLGCGPIGLAIVAAMHLRGIEPILAADLSPTRRGLALAMGAHEAVDPELEPAFEAWNRVGRNKRLVVFEAIGIPGIIDSVLRCAPQRTRIVVAGVCMVPDSITPYYGISKELDIRFVLGCDPDEFAESLRSIAEGEIDVSPMITGEVDLDGLPGMFEELADPGPERPAARADSEGRGIEECGQSGDPGRHGKVLVVP